MAPPRFEKIHAIRASAFTLVAIVFGQLVIGAIMRHYGAGMAIPTFPLAFGKLIPHFDSFAISIHYAHRVGAVVVTLAILWLLGLILLDARREPRLIAPALLLTSLLLFQIILGANVIWLARPPVATGLHVINGAMILGVAVLLATRSTLLAARNVTTQEAAPR